MTVIREQVLNQISEDIEVDRNPLKIFFLAILGLILIFATTYSFNQFINTARSGYLLWGTINGLAFIVIAILQILLVKSRVKLLLIIFLETFGPILIFYKHLYPKFSFWLLAGSAPFFYLFYFGRLRRPRTAREHN